MSNIVLKNVCKSYDKEHYAVQDFSLEIPDREFVIFVGPSGCGKSTTLRMIAGLEAITSGELWIDGQLCNYVEAKDRDLSMVFQNYALYPNMTVYENMAFSLKIRKQPKDEVDKKVHEAAKMLGIEHLLDRRPAALSGGQKQRVAIGSAIMRRPKAFLMDEPLSNLDAKLRAQIRTDLIELHQKLGTTFVYVTHDQVEAMSMGTDIILMESGKIQQHAAPAQLYAEPANVFAARFIGSPPMNVLSAAVAGDKVSPKVEKIGFRPEKARLMSEEEVPGLRELVISGEVVAREMLGDQTQYKLTTGFGSVSVKDFGDSVCSYGACRIAVPYKDVACFDAAQKLIGFGLLRGDQFVAD